MIVDLSYIGRQVKISDDDADDFIIKTISQTKTFYEKALIDEIFHRAMPDWFFVDLGAHIGNHTLFLGGVLNLHGISIEANPNTYIKLKNNLRLNGLEKTVDAHNVAVGGKRGKVVSLESDIPKNSGASRVSLDPRGEIEQITLDSLQLKKVDFIKMDIEGCELAALQGARTTLLRCMPVLCLEIINLDQFAQIKEWLQALGYQPIRRFNATPTYIFEA